MCKACEVLEKTDELVLFAEQVTTIENAIFRVFRDSPKIIAVCRDSLVKELAKAQKSLMELSGLVEEHDSFSENNLSLCGSVIKKAEEYGILLKGEAYEIDGGEGSGNWGHKGRKGKVGGSGKGGGGSQGEISSGDYVTKNGDALPKTKKGTSYNHEIMSEVERIARDDEKNGRVPKGSFDKVVDSLTDKDVVYQKGEGGKEFASVPGLAGKVDTKTYGKSPEVQAAYDKLAKEGPKIASDMVGVSKDSGMYLTGLENCVKGGSHVSEKIDRKYNPEKDGTEADYVANMGDAVRFTAMTTNDNYVEGVKKMISGLEKKGFTIEGVENKFVDEKTGKEKLDSVYRAVHLDVRNKNGCRFEVQIHSEESLAVKNKNHAMYEEQRKVGTSPERVAELDKAMADNWKKYKNPKGIETIKNYKKK